MDKNTIPARIIIVGTSTMKLATRFSNLEREMSARKPKSFLYDDYMDNTMYADEIPARSRRPVRTYQDLDQFDDEEVVVTRPRGGGGMRGGGGAPRTSRPADPIYGVDGTVFAAPRTGGRGGGRGGGGIRKRHPAYALLDESPRRRAAPRGRVREEIIEYVTEPVRSRRPATRVIRRAAPRTQTITRIVKRPAFKKTLGNKRGGVVRGKPKKEDVRAKMGTDDLDRELDAYMKTSKHPRVEATIAE